MNFIDTVRAELHHNRRVHGDHGRIIELQTDYDNADANLRADGVTDGTAVARAVIAENLARQIRSQADHLEAGRLARWTSVLPSPDTIRAEADEWDRKAALHWKGAEEVD